MSYKFERKKNIKIFIYSEKDSYYIKNKNYIKATDKIIEDNSITIKLKYKSLLVVISHLIIIYLILSPLCIECNQRKLKSYLSTIKLKTNGSEDIKILGDQYKGTNPDEIYINGTKSSNISKSYYFTESDDNINNFTLVWADTPTNIRYMFCRCKNIIEIDLSDFDLSNINNMAYMFSGCSLLTSIDLTNVNTEQVNAMNGLFQDCVSLTFVNLSSFNTKSLTSMKQLLSSKPKLPYLIELFLYYYITF